MSTNALRNNFENAYYNLMTRELDLGYMEESNPGYREQMFRLWDGREDYLTNETQEAWIGYQLGVSNAPTYTYEKEIHVLDHGYVKYVNHMGSDLDIVRDARMSHDAVWRTGEDKGKDEKLITRLHTNHHTSPIEQQFVKFEICIPKFVMFQWTRHRTWSYLHINEVSARYTEVEDKFYVPELNKITNQSQINKQGRTDNQNEHADIIQRDLNTFCESAFALYKTFLSLNCPRELARSILPLGTYTKLRVTVDLHNLLHFIKLRDDPHAQYEIQVYAQAMKEIIKDLFPVLHGIAFGKDITK